MSETLNGPGVFVIADREELLAYIGRLFDQLERSVSEKIAAAEERGRRRGVEEAAKMLREVKEIPCPCIGWPTIRLLIADGQVRFDDVALVAADDLFRCDFVPVPLPLAQRILAALEEAAPLCETENQELIALAAELRARVEGKS